MFGGVGTTPFDFGAAGATAGTEALPEGAPTINKAPAIPIVHNA